MGRVWAALGAIVVVAILWVAIVGGTGVFAAPWDPRMPEDKLEAQLRVRWDAGRVSCDKLDWFQGSPALNMYAHPDYQCDIWRRKDGLTKQWYETNSESITETAGWGP